VQPIERAPSSADDRMVSHAFSTRGSICAIEVQALIAFRGSGMYDASPSRRARHPPEPHLQGAPM